MPTPLKIAFTSCAEATQFPRPPVWTRIADAWPAPLVPHFVAGAVCPSGGLTGPHTLPRDDRQ
ncbi:hypothetical protein [Pseudacidovorax intermedius]|uniref:hypothetical protein n=1 Tax=Pseudacidovorax intermedius TaxID=433924 RepID=UPI0026F1CD97|nr:hypothetical protein [Pseudacidovorax intermedius]